MQSLAALLLAKGVDPAAGGWTRLRAARAISPDGRYVVGDGIRNGNTEAFLADLGPINQPPAVTQPVAAQFASQGQPFTLALPANTFTDPDAGQTLTYSATGLPAWLSFDPGTRTFSGTPDALGQSTVTVRATDDGTPPRFAETTLSISVLGTAVPPPGLVAWWRGFGNADDVFGRANGTFHNGMTAAGGIFTLDGSDDTMAIGQPPILDQPNGTWSAWIRPTAAPTGRYAVVLSRWENAPGGNSVSLFIHQPGPPGSAWLFQGDIAHGPQLADSQYALSPTIIQPDTWTHVALTFDDVTDSLKIYLNGELQGTATQAGSLFHGNGQWRLGFNPGSVANAFPGQMSDPMIFNRALSAAELQAITAAGIGGFALNSPPTVVAAIADQVAHPGRPFTFTVPANTFADADAGQTLTYSATGLPAWLSFNPATRTFSGTPPALGASTVTVTATDSGALAMSTPFTVTVAFAPGAAGLAALGDLPGGSFLSVAHDVSDDGGTVVGQGTSANGDEAFRWSGGTMIGLGDLPGWDFSSYAYAVSGDGSTAVGYSPATGGYQAFRWKGGTMTGLGDLPGGSFESYAHDVSADGSTVVGQSTSANGLEAFRWVGGTMTGLGDLPGGGFTSNANGVSADGGTVVGYGISANGPEAFRWSGGTMTGLGDLPGGIFQSVAEAVSADGFTVVGNSYSANGYEAFRWQGGTMVALGDLPGGGFFSMAKGVSADGNTVVGQGTTDTGSEAFVWMAGSGMQTLARRLQAAGVNPADSGWTVLSAARSVSADGRFVVGLGTRYGNTEAFIADLGLAAANLPPVANGDTLARRDNATTAKVLCAALLANDTDPDGDPRTITAVGGATPAGATVALSGAWVIYTVPSAAAGAGSFTYTLSDGPGGHTVTGTVTVAVEAAPSQPPAGPPNSAAIALNGTDVVVTFIGVPGRSYRVQFTTGGAPPYVWADFSPPADYVAPANGVFIHTDPQPTGPVRLYRAVAR